MSPKSLQELVDAHYGRLFRAARFLCGDESVAEDLIQETFLAAADARKRFRGESSYYTWLYAILLNKFRRWLRQKDSSFLSLSHLTDEDSRRNVAERLEADTARPVENVLQQEAASRVREAIDQLSADHRAVITLRYVEDMSYQEIADAVDCPLGTVKSRIHYALQQIGQYLEETE
ncbi:MAG: sigma-70 family RNA polymerase sigma factor [Candidatus Brocadiia bacterium]